MSKRKPSENDGKNLDGSWRRPPTPFDEAKKKIFLAEFEKHGLHYLAARTAGTSAKTVYEHLKTDEEFAEAYAEASEAAADVAEQALRRRGIEGVERPIIGGEFRDQIVAYETVYSDGCLLALLKARRASAYRDKVDATVAITGGVLAVPTSAAPQDADAWEKEQGENAKGRSNG